MICEYCGSTLIDYYCPSCNILNYGRLIEEALNLVEKGKYEEANNLLKFTIKKV